MQILKAYANRSIAAIYPNKIWAVIKPKHPFVLWGHLTGATFKAGALTGWQNPQPASARNWGFTHETKKPVDVSDAKITVHMGKSFQVWVGVDPGCSRKQMCAAVNTHTAGVLVLQFANGKTVELPL